MTSQTSHPTSTNAELEFRNVSLSFDDKPALTNISFKLERAEMIFLTGASGSGKSVLLHLAMGLLREFGWPFRGETPTPMAGQGA